MEDVKDSHYNFMVLFPCLATENEDVIHIDGHYSFINEFLEDVIHHHLECGRTVCEAKEHDQRLEKASVQPKGGLPFISFFDLNVVVSPANVQLSEILSFGFGDIVEDVWGGYL